MTVMRYCLLILVAFVCSVTFTYAQELAIEPIPEEDIMVVPAPTEEVEAEETILEEPSRKKKRKNRKKAKKPSHQLTFDIVSSGDADRVKAMKKRDSINYYRTNEAGETALTLAIQMEDVHMVEALVKRAVINQKNEAGETPLTLAIKNGNVDIITLVAKRAKASLKNTAGEAPLFLAIGLGDMDLLDHLIERGAKVNRKSNGVTPLAQTAIVNKPRTAAFLIEHGAIVNKPTDNGETPLYIATKKGHDLVAGILISKSADPIGDTNWKTKIGTPLLHIAAAHGNPEIVRLLVNNGADVETLDFMENSALSIAALSGNTPNIQALVQSNANINHQNLQGDTPLMLASTSYQDDAVTQLLDNGADATIRNFMGYAAADFYSTNVLDGLFAQKGVKQLETKNNTTNSQKPRSPQQQKTIIGNNQ